MAVGDNYEKLAKLQAQLNQVTKELDDKTARWEYLSDTWIRVAGNPVEICYN